MASKNPSLMRALHWKPTEETFMDVAGEVAVLPRRGSAEDEDACLWASVQAGDESAFEELVHRHCGKVASVAGRLLRNAADVEEVVQEAFVRAFETRLRYPHLRCIRGWLLRITINLCNSRRRTAWWRRTLLTADYRGVEPAAADPAERGTVDGALWNAVQALPDTLQLPFLLRYTEELSGAEIAAILGCNESTVWSRIYTARRKLRERLGDAFAMPPDASL